MKTQEERSATTMSFNKDLGGEGVTRRSFMGGMGALMATAAAFATGVSTAHADEAAEAEEAEAEEAAAETEEAATEEETATEETTTTKTVIESTTGWTGTPEDLFNRGMCTMPLEDLNAYRRAYIDAQTDYTKEDGTVVPAVYVKARALIHTYGFGCGDVVDVDTCFDDIMRAMSEDDAQAFIDMPLGVEFSAYQMSIETGRDVDECTEICDRLAEDGYLTAYDNNSGRYYHHAPAAIGVLEYHVDDAVESDNTATTLASNTVQYDIAECGVPTMHFVPIDQDVISTGTFYDYDDIKEMARNTNYICISPCYCRYSALASVAGHENIPTFEDFATGEYEDYFSEVSNERVETCMYFGDEARYWVDRGMAREITGEQAAEYIQRSWEDGFMLQTSFEKDLMVVCSCSADSCGLVAMFNALGDPDTIATYPAFQHWSRYTLQVDADACIACGTCVDRCPMHCISINDDGWAEPAGNCFRCGQCAYVCPQEARKLVPLDESEVPELANNHMDLINEQAAWRFEAGLITFPETTEETATEEAAAEETAEEETAEEVAAE